MEVASGGVVVSLTRDDATALARQLAEALQLAYRVRGRQAPVLLRAFADQVSRASRGPGSARFRADAQASASRGTGEFREPPSLPASDQPVRLSIREAAQLADVSEGYMRRCCRRGDVEALQGHRGWAVDVASLSAWISQRRKKTDNRKAA